MKETIKLTFILFLVVFFALFINVTKGKDELNFSIQLPTLEEEFSFPVYASKYNGLYKNQKSNGVYAMVGANSDGSHRIYFIRTAGAAKAVIGRMESADLSKGTTNFYDGNNVEITVEFSDNELRVPKKLGMGNAQLEGFYTRTKEINLFSYSEFEY